MTEASASTQTASTPIGLYSIGIRGLDVPDLVAFAAVHRIPFLHLRGGANGFDLAARSRSTLAAWAGQIRDQQVPVTLVTSDADLTDFLTPATASHRAALSGLERLAEAATVLGASAVRLLARHPLPRAQCAGLAIADLTGRHRLRILVELHHPDWFAPSHLPVVDDLLIDQLGLGLLIDTAQLHHAWLQHQVRAPLARLASQAVVAHLCDDGTGFTGAGHHLAATTLASDRVACELAVEWTGPERTSQHCLARYQQALAWWHQTTGATR
jgi:hypothetical protein